MTSIEHQRVILDYFTAEEPGHWLDLIEACDWQAGPYLAQLLHDHRFKALCGERSTVLLLTEGDQLLSFCTLAEQDDIPSTDLTPWIGFVYTFPAWRGRHCAGALIRHAENLAAQSGYRYTYISTDHTGLYEKYGYAFLRMMTDRQGSPSRVYRKELMHP